MVDIVALAATFSLATLMIMQAVKPLLEKVPGILLPENQEAHDAFLRLVQFALNFGMLFVTWKTTPAFNGLNYQWYDLLAIALGQAVLSHVTYKSAVAGKVDPPAAVAYHRAVAPPEQLTAENIPVVPRS